VEKLVVLRISHSKTNSLWDLLPTVENAALLKTDDCSTFETPVFRGSGACRPPELATLRAFHTSNRRDLFQ
jgi:hypothetical protein